jgi:MoaA/NifB/PqqE/SkfB family radical SAM enzyme
VLYGFGEPFIHPQILEVLRIARKRLQDNGEILISTNGSLLTQQIAEKITKEIGVDSISFSVDTISQAKLSRLREGSNLKLIASNIETLAKSKDEAKRDFRLGLETVIMEDNFSDLPELVKFAAEKNVDYIIVSHTLNSPVLG